MKTYVQCPACGEKHPCDKKYVAVENIEEDFQGLGEPVTAATLAAATPIIVAAIKILKDSGLLNKNEKV